MKSPHLPPLESAPDGRSRGFSEVLRLIRRQTERWSSISITALRTIADGRLDQLWYPLRWRLSGYNFGSEATESLNLDPARCNAHFNSGGPDLARVLRTIEIPAGSRMLDFGSGKGGATITFCTFPFSAVVGVELSPELISIAEANCRRAGMTKAHFVQTDAALYADLDEVTHVYMYHPFPCEIVSKVSDNLKASLARKARRLTLIYKNPACDSALLENGIFRLEREVSFGRSTPDDQCFRIYIHEPGPTAAVQ